MVKRWYAGSWCEIHVNDRGKGGWLLYMEFWNHFLNGGRVRTPLSNPETLAVTAVLERTCQIFICSFARSKFVCFQDVASLFWLARGRCLQSKDLGPEMNANRT